MKTISSDWIADLPDDGERAYDRRLQEARSSAITFMGLARKPSGQVVRRLAEKGFEPGIIDHVLNDLQADGYLDDLSLAARIVRQRQDGRQAESKEALRRRMLGQGLAEDAVEEALVETVNDRQAALTLLESRFASEWPTADRRQLQKIARFLAGRGFSADLVAQILLSRQADL